MKRGMVYLVNLGDGMGSEQGNERPCLIVQNDIGNRYSPTTIVVPLTTKRTGKKLLPTQVSISTTDFLDDKHLNKESVALCEQLRTISKTERIVPYNGGTGYIGTISEKKMKEISKAMMISLGVEC